jgi:uncharacterized protein YjbJ (UPF0337 family)
MTDAITQEATIIRAVELPQALKKVVEARIKERTERARERAVGTIKNYMEYMAEATERLTKAKETTEKEVKEWAETITRLKEAGFKPETDEWSQDIVVNTKEGRLADLARAIGPLNPNSVDKEIHDAEKKLVRVSIYGLHAKNVKVIYIHKLRETDRCKIVTELIPAKVEHKLVCDV